VARCARWPAAPGPMLYIEDGQEWSQFFGHLFLWKLCNQRIGGTQCLDRPILCDESCVSHSGEPFELAFCKDFVDPKQLLQSRRRYTCGIGYGGVAESESVFFASIARERISKQRDCIWTIKASANAKPALIGAGCWPSQVSAINVRPRLPHESAFWPLLTMA
jgi:hypothetical protein